MKLAAGGRVPLLEPKALVLWPKPAMAGGGRGNVGKRVRVYKADNSGGARQWAVQGRQATVADSDMPSTVPATPSNGPRGAAVAWRMQVAAKQTALRVLVYTM